VIETQNGGVTQYYYGNYLNQPTWSYRLPFAFMLLMNESVVQGQGVLISMGIVVVQNGTIVANPQPYWFDRIMIHDPAAAAAGFIVSGYRYTPVGAASLLGFYYDAELVFGGGGGGEVTQFEQLSAPSACSTTLRPRITTPPSPHITASARTQLRRPQTPTSPT